MKQKYLFGKTMVYMSALSASAASIVRLPRIIHGHDMHSKAINPEGPEDDKEAVKAFNAAIDQALDEGWHLTTTAAIEDTADVEKLPKSLSGFTGVEDSDLDAAIKEADEKLAEAAKSLEAKDETIKALNEKISGQEKKIDVLTEENRKLVKENKALKKDIKGFEKAAAKRPEDSQALFDENKALKEEAQKLSDELEAANTPQPAPKPAKKAASKKSK